MLSYLLVSISAHAISMPEFMHRCIDGYHASNKEELTTQEQKEKEAFFKQFDNCQLEYRQLTSVAQEVSRSYVRSN
jgi:hypothetical protein